MGIKTKFLVPYVVVCVASGNAFGFEVTTLTSTPNIVTGDYVLGYSFHTNSNLDITALGALSNPYGNLRSVGLWDSQGTLLISATVDGSEPITNSMNYTSTLTTHTSSGVFLKAGQDYVVGATGGAYWAIDPTFAVDSHITYLHGLYGSGSSPFSAPNTANGHDYFGGSFQAEVSTVRPVPEPCTILLAGTSVLAMCRRRLKAVRQQPWL